MLVLTRKPGERIVVGDAEVIITVVSLGPGRVKLGVEAAKQVPVDRGEVYDRKLAERSGDYSHQKHRQASGNYEKQ